MAVLYRKYRPQTFAQVVSQKHIIQTLKNQIAAGNPAHAYLFTGTRGVGKTSIARIVAKALNCKKGQDGDACGDCDSCKEIENGNFIDLVEVDAASNTGVDNIRELIEHVKFAPSIGRYKVFIIDEVHMLSKGAFNALLKTLEEPPKHAIFILATTEINKVPPTIISRTIRFDFKALSQADLSQHLAKVAREENISLAPEILDLIARSSEGSVRDSLSLLGKVLTLGSQANLSQAEQLLGVTDIAVCAELFEKIATGQAQALPQFFDELLERSPDFKILNRDFLEFLRKVLIFKITGLDESLPDWVMGKITALGESFTATDVIFYIRLFLRSFKELDTAPNAQIPLLLASLEAAFKKKPETPAVKKNSGVIVSSHSVPAAQAPRQDSSAVAEAEPASEKIAPENLTLDEVVTLWPKTIALVKQINGPLSSLLRKAELLEPQSGRIVLGVKFLFDKQSIENPKNLAIINEALKNSFGKNIGLRAEVLKDGNDKPLGTTEAFSQALQVFGGELVE